MNETLLKRFIDATNEPGSAAPPDSAFYREALWETVRSLIIRVESLERRLSQTEKRVEFKTQLKRNGGK